MVVNYTINFGLEFNPSKDPSFRRAEVGSSLVQTSAVTLAAVISGFVYKVNFCHTELNRSRGNGQLAGTV